MRWLLFSAPGSVVSVRVPVWEFTWIDAFGGQPVAVVLDGVWLVGAVLARRSSGDRGR